MKGVLEAAAHLIEDVYSGKISPRIAGCSRRSLAWRCGRSVRQIWKCAAQNWSCRKWKAEHLRTTAYRRSS